MLTGSDTPAITWRVIRGETLSWRCWDGDYVVFNPLSGNTHALNILSGEILKRIMAETATADDVCTHVAEFLDIDADSRLASTVSEALGGLEEAGLVEPVP